MRLSLRNPSILIYAGIALSAAVTCFSFPPYRFGLLMFVGLIPLFLGFDSAPNWKIAAFRGWIFGFLSNTAVCWWVSHSIQEFAQLPAFFGYVGVFILSVFEQASWPILGALRFWVHRRYGKKPLLWTPLAIFTLDAFLPKYFPNTLGNAFYSSPRLSQFADLAGVWGLTALLVATNEWGAAAISRLFNKKYWSAQEFKRHSVACAALISFAAYYSLARYEQIQELKKYPAETIKIALVQPNLNAAQVVRQTTDKDTGRMQVLTNMLSLTSEAINQNPHFIFWPETAYPDTYHGESPTESVGVTQTLDQFLTEKKVSLLFGARDQIGVKRYNALFLANAGEKQAYHKQRLLQFAEHIPFADEVPALGAFAKKLGASHFAFGTSVEPFRLRDWKLGPMICLEGLYPWFVRDLVRAGADILVNATNDAWFGPEREPALHLALTTFRSIETRRPLARATNTGHSALIDIDGSLLLKTELDQKIAVTGKLPIYKSLTSPFVRYGDLLFALALLIVSWPFLGRLPKRFR